MWTIASGGQLWAVLSAPFCVWFAIAAAQRTEIDGGVSQSPPRVAVIAAAILIALAALLSNDLSEAASRVLLLSMLAYLAAFDLRCLAIPVAPTLAMTAAGLGFGVFDGSFVARSIAAALGWGVFQMLASLYRWVRGREGLGAGDGMIAALIGAWLGEGLAWSIAIGAGLGVAWALLAGRAIASARPIPLAPALAAGACIFTIARSLSGEV